MLFIKLNIKKVLLELSRRTEKTSKREKRYKKKEMSSVWEVKKNADMEESKREKQISIREKKTEPIGQQQGMRKVSITKMETQISGEEGTQILEEGTQILGEEGTQILGEEGTQILTEDALKLQTKVRYEFESTGINQTI